MHEIELPPTFRITPADAAGHPELIEEFRRSCPGGEVVIGEDTTCPHCRAAGIRVGDDGVIRQTGSERRKAKRKSARSARRANRKR